MQNRTEINQEEFLELIHFIYERNVTKLRTKLTYYKLEKRTNYPEIVAQLAQIAMKEGKEMEQEVNNFFQNSNQTSIGSNHSPQKLKNKPYDKKDRQKDLTSLIYIIKNGLLNQLEEKLVTYLENGNPENDFIQLYQFAEPDKNIFFANQIARIITKVCPNIILPERQNTPISVPLLLRKANFTDAQTVVHVNFTNSKDAKQFMDALFIMDIAQINEQESSRFRENKKNDDSLYTIILTLQEIEAMQIKLLEFKAVADEFLKMLHPDEAYIQSYNENQIKESLPPPIHYTREVYNPLGFTPLCLAILDGDNQQIEHLIKNGADINQPSSQGTTAIAAAIYGGNLEAVKCLLESKKEIKKVYKEQKNPLHLVAGRIECHAEIIKLILEKRPEYLAEKTTTGETAFDIAKRNPNSLVLRTLKYYSHRQEIIEKARIIKQINRNNATLFRPRLPDELLAKIAAHAYSGFAEKHGGAYYSQDEAEKIAKHNLNFVKPRF